MPCFSASWAARALPSAVFGPRDLAPLRRLARALLLSPTTKVGGSGAPAWLMGTAARGAAPTSDMAEFLRWGAEVDAGQRDRRAVAEAPE
jgi:hypothetical protein